MRKHIQLQLCLQVETVLMMMIIIIIIVLKHTERRKYFILNYFQIYVFAKYLFKYSPVQLSIIVKIYFCFTDMLSAPHVYLSLYSFW